MRRKLSGGRGLQRFKLVGIILLLILICGLPVRADEIDKLNSLKEEIDKLVNRSRGLAYGILTALKDIDETCSGSESRALVGMKPVARQKLGQLQYLKDGFESNAGRADDLIKSFDKKYAKIKSPSGAESKLKAEINALQSDLKKYRDYVNRYYGEAVRKYGPPAQPEAGINAASLAGVQRPTGLHISGELSSSAGETSYNRPHADPQTDLSTTDFNLRVNGTFSPSQKMHIPFHISHKNTIEQRKISLTSFGAGIRHDFRDNFSTKFNLDYSGYSDDANESLNYGDFKFGAGMVYRSRRMETSLDLGLRSRSYGNNENANYGVFNFNPRLVMHAGKGRIVTGLNYLKKSNEIEALDHRELSPYFQWEFSKNGSALSFQYQKFSHPNQDDSPQDNNRIKASLFFKRTKPGGSSVYGPEVALYRYPNAEDNDFADFAFVVKSFHSGKKTSLSSLRLVYRKYDDTAKYDFAQLSIRKSKRPLGSGYGWERNLSVRFYTQSSDKDDPLRFSNIHPPHTLDYYNKLGWTLAGQSKLRQFTFGPMFGAKMYFDSERHDAFENEVDYLWQNPRNSILGGLHISAMIQPSQVVRITAGMRYQLNFLYNADPFRKYSLTDLNFSVNYLFNPRLVIELKGNFYITRASIESDTDLDKTSVLLQIRYLFDFVRQ